jgi:hypothetical protein
VNLPVIGKFPVVTAETNFTISGKLLIYSLSICCFSISIKPPLLGIGGHQNHSSDFLLREDF